MPPYPGFTGFDKPYSQLMQLSCQEMEALAGMILPVGAVTPSRTSTSHMIRFQDVPLYVKKSVYFHIMAQ